MPLTQRMRQRQASTISGGKAIANRQNTLVVSSDPRRRLAVWGGTAALMLFPLLPDLLTGAVDRDPGDFVFLAMLLTGVGAAYELAARTRDSRAFMTACAIAIIAILLLAWINLAVGIIGSEDHPANLIYAAVIALPACGSLLTRLRPLGMVRVMMATAIAQVTAFVIVLIAGLGFTGPITIFFCALWLISAVSFRRAAQPA